MLGLSGGIDSAVVAALAVRAVGPARVHGLVLPDNATAKSDLADAASVARKLALKTSTASIQPYLDVFTANHQDADRTSIGNAKARFRMILLHAEAAKRAGLVLGTGNKTEILLGYFSKYGDGGVDVQPIGDLYKTQVRLLAEHLGLPARVRTKPPTAGLWAGQTDEAELGMAYATLDRLLLGLEIRLDHDQIAKILAIPESEVRRIETMRAASQHKRVMPLIPKLGLRTVGSDWRAATLEA